MMMMMRMMTKHKKLCQCLKSGAYRYHAL